MNFKEYWELLWAIRRDCNVEQYYDEIVRPLLKEAAQNVSGVKVVPTFDTRNHRSRRRKERYKCITAVGGRPLWPDYIFVPCAYTDKHPLAPWVKVEFKTPNVEEGSGELLKYVPIEERLKSHRGQIEGNLSTCPLIFTDGISWLFLSDGSGLDEGKPLGDNERCALVDRTGKRNRSMYEVRLVPNPDEQFDRLRAQISKFILCSINKTSKARSE